MKSESTIEEWQMQTAQVQSFTLTMWLEAVAAMPSIVAGSTLKLCPESVTLNVTLKDPTPGNLTSKDPVRDVSPAACVIKR